MLDLDHQSQVLQASHELTLHLGHPTGAGNTELETGDSTTRAFNGESERSFVPQLPPPSSSGRRGAHSDRNLTDIAKLKRKLGLQLIQIMLVNPHFHKTGRGDERRLSVIYGLKLEPAEPRIVQTLSQLRS
jgi:hypothetical protein